MAKKKSGGGFKAAVVVGLGVLVVHATHGNVLSAASGAPSASASRAIAYAWQQVGKPYCWGGTGPSCYDCSGLTMEAYGLPGSERTSEEQYAALRHVSHPRPGDLVFAPGALQPGEASPGHVGMVISGGRVIQAYATGYPIDVTSLSNFAAGAGGIVGYARPGGA